MHYNNESYIYRYILKASGTYSKIGFLLKYFITVTSQTIALGVMFLLLSFCTLFSSLSSFSLTFHLSSEHLCWWLFQRDDMEAIPGYLSLHQTADIMTLKWTPNQLMNGSVGDLDYERRYKIKRPSIPGKISIVWHPSCQSGSVLLVVFQYLFPLFFVVVFNWFLYFSKIFLSVPFAISWLDLSQFMLVYSCPTHSHLYVSPFGCLEERERWGTYF